VEDRGGWYPRGQRKGDRPEEALMRELCTYPTQESWELQEAGLVDVMDLRAASILVGAF